MVNSKFKLLVRSEENQQIKGNNALFGWHKIE